MRVTFHDEKEGDTSKPRDVQPSPMQVPMRERSKSPSPQRNTEQLKNPNTGPPSSKSPDLAIIKPILKKEQSAEKPKEEPKQPKKGKLLDKATIEEMINFEVQRQLAIFKEQNKKDIDQQI